jgi:hypothetical protein
MLFVRRALSKTKLLRRQECGVPRCDNRFSFEATQIALSRRRQTKRVSRLGVKVIILPTAGRLADPFRLLVQWLQKPLEARSIRRTRSLNRISAAG